MTSSPINLDTDLLAGLEISVKRKYYVARYCSAIDHMESVDLMWNMYGLMVFSIKEEWVRELVKLTGSYEEVTELLAKYGTCLLYTSPSPRDLSTSRMPSSA